MSPELATLPTTPAQHAVDRQPHGVAHRHQARCWELLIRRDMRDAHEPQAHDRHVHFPVRTLRLRIFHDLLSCI